jgi:hypothetical protein
MGEAEVRVLGSIISIVGSITAVIYGVWRILKIFKDSILKEISNSANTTVSTIEKETLKNEIAINKAVQPIITRLDSVEKTVQEHDKKINSIQKVQNENLAVAIEYKTLKNK